MSCNVGYKCKTCEVETDTCFNHGQAYLRALYKVWPHVKALLRAMEPLQGVLYSMDVTLNSNGWYDSDLKEFLYEHHEYTGGVKHNVVIRDEYGREEPITGG